MVYRTDQKQLGLTIKISSHRKYGNGAVGSGRKNSSGKKAVISQKGCADTVVTGTTTTNLLSAVRKQFNIPHSVTINRKGETCI